MSNLYRVHILLEREQYRILSEMAERKGQSLSELIREIVRQYLAEQDREARLRRELQALDALTRIRKQIEAQHGVYRGDILAEARQERDQDIERVWKGAQ
jgi:metal-responsive CopG/Arc/MetJ family transcriptional regulator